MLTYQDWQEIKTELIPEIEPTFKKAGIQLSAPIDEIIDIFQGVLERDNVDESLNGRDDIEKLLRLLYVDGNIKYLGSTLDVLSGKLEGYIKKIFKIVNQALLANGEGLLAHHLKTIFGLFKANNHPDFVNFTSNYVSEFFNKASPNYNNPEHFKTAHKLGDHFKIF